MALILMVTELCPIYCAKRFSNERTVSYLLLVLDFPEVPLDNNEAERALREYVIKGKISNGTRTLCWNSSGGKFFSPW